MIPASIYLGLCAAPLWTAQCSYFSKMAARYATITGQEEGAVVSTMFGIFFMFFQFCKSDYVNPLSLQIIPENDLTLVLLPRVYYGFNLFSNK